MKVFLFLSSLSLPPTCPHTSPVSALILSSDSPLPRKAAPTARDHFYLKSGHGSKESRHVEERDAGEEKRGKEEGEEERGGESGRKGVFFFEAREEKAVERREKKEDQKFEGRGPVKCDMSKRGKDSLGLEQGLGGAVAFSF